MTLHIDEKLLERVIVATGATSKTQAVDLALRDLDRRAELLRLARAGLGLSPAEVKEAFDPASDTDAVAALNEERRAYGRKSRPR